MPLLGPVLNLCCTASVAFATDAIIAAVGLEPSNGFARLYSSARCAASVFVLLYH
jgi:hypothetical protein